MNFYSIKYQLLKEKITINYSIGKQNEAVKFKKESFRCFIY